MLPLLLALSGFAAEPALEVARGEAALAEGDARAAYAHAREAVRADVDDWRAVRLWLRSGDAVGLAGMVEAEVYGLAQRSGSLRVAHAWTRVADGEMAPEALAAPVVRHADPTLAALAMAERAAALGLTELALTLLEAHPDAEAVRVRLQALLAEGRSLDATGLAQESWLRHPDHPEVLRPLFDEPGADRVIRKGRKVLLKQLLRRVEQVDDPVFLWRARALFVGVDDPAAERIAARLEGLGEPARLARPRLERPALEATALGWAADPGWSLAAAHDLAAAELVVAGELMVDALDRGGERTEAGRRLGLVRTRVDSLTLAVRHAEALVEARDLDAAQEAAAAALRLAAGPAPDDVGRVERGRHAAELASALGIRGRVRLEAGDTLGAAFDLVTAQTLSRAEADPLAERALGALGALPDLERDSPSGPHPIDAGIEVAAQRAASTPGPAADLVRRLALAGEPDASTRRQRLARAWSIAGTSHEPDPLVGAVVAAALAPQPQRLAAAATQLALAGEADAAFVAWAAVRSQGAAAPGLLDTWRGVGSADDAADVLAALWTDAGSVGSPAGFADIGDPLPERTIATTAGRLELRELRGRVVVLNLWASWCGPCAVELPRLDALVAGLKAEGLTVDLLAVSTDDTRDAWLGGARKLGLGTALMGWDRDLGMAVGAVTVPLTLVVDGDGLIRARYLGWAEEHMPALEEEIRALASP